MNEEYYFDEEKESLDKLEWLVLGILFTRNPRNIFAVLMLLRKAQRSRPFLRMMRKVKQECQRRIGSHE